MTKPVYTGLYTPPRNSVLDSLHDYIARRPTGLGGYNCRSFVNCRVQSLAGQEMDWVGMSSNSNPSGTVVVARLARSAGLGPVCAPLSCESLLLCFGCYEIAPAALLCFLALRR